VAYQSSIRCHCLLYSKSEALTTAVVEFPAIWLCSSSRSYYLAPCRCSERSVIVVWRIRRYLRSSLSMAGNKLPPSADSDVDVTRTAARATDNSSATLLVLSSATPLSKSLSAPYTTLIASEDWNRWRDYLLEMENRRRDPVERQTLTSIGRSRRSRTCMPTGSAAR